MESQLESQKKFYEDKIQELEQQNNLVQNIQLQKRINDEQYITNLNRINELEEKLKAKELELNNKESMLNGNLLPKICEKGEYINFIKDIVFRNIFNDPIEIQNKKKNKLESFITDESEYIIYKDDEVIISNKGKIFIRILYSNDCIHKLYFDINVSMINNKILPFIIKCCKQRYNESENMNRYINREPYIIKFFKPNNFL